MTPLIETYKLVNLCYKVTFPPLVFIHKSTTDVFFYRTHNDNYCTAHTIRRAGVYLNVYLFKNQDYSYCVLVYICLLHPWDSIRSDIVYLTHISVKSDIVYLTRISVRSDTVYLTRILVKNLHKQLLVICMLKCGSEFWLISSTAAASSLLRFPSNYSKSTLKNVANEKAHSQKCICLCVVWISNMYIEACSCNKLKTIFFFLLVPAKKWTVEMTCRNHQRGSRVVN